jgi:hypothetical protein
MRLEAIDLLEKRFDLAGGWVGRSVSTQQHRSGSLLRQKLQKLDRVVGLLLLEGLDEGLAGSDVQSAVEREVVVGIRPPNGPLFPDGLPQAPKRRNRFRSASSPNQSRRHTKRSFSSDLAGRVAFSPCPVGLLSRGVSIPASASFVDLRRTPSQSRS